MRGKLFLISKKHIQWRGTERAIFFQLIFVLFERYFVQLGVPNAIIYILDFVNVYLLVNLLKNKGNREFSLLILIYIMLIGGSLCIAIANYFVYGNNILFSILEIRNLIRFLIFFLAAVRYTKAEHLDTVFSVLELHFFINSIFIVYQYFTYFPPTASWMRGDLLNGFFGNLRGGNTFVNVEMLVILAYNFVKWTKKETKLQHVFLIIATSMVVAGLIELKAYFIEIFAVYAWYLFFVKKSKREKQLNVIIILFGIMLSYGAIQIMLKEYPWFADVFSIKGLIESFTSSSYATVDDINRFTGFFTISDKIFRRNVFDILFGIGLGNGAVSRIAGKTTLFASNYANSNYSWFSGTYIFVQCGLIGFLLYISTFVFLFSKKKSDKYKTFSNMILLLSIFLVFYGEALKTDAGYFLYFAIASGFIKYRSKRMELGGLDVIIDNSTSL